MTKKWTKFPHADKAYAYDAAGLKKHWARLHRGDCEPLPKDAGVLDAWRHFHAGEFAQAVDAGRAAGGSGINAEFVVAAAQVLDEGVATHQRSTRGGRAAGRAGAVPFGW